MQRVGPPPPDGVTSFLHSAARGELRLWLPTPTILVFRYRGYSDGDFMPFVEMVYRRTLARVDPPHKIFADCEEQTGFSTQFRQGMIDFTRRAVPFTDEWLLLVKSRLVAVGVMLARVAVGFPARHTEVTTRNDVFEARLEEAVRSSTAKTQPSAVPAP